MLIQLNQLNSLQQLYIIQQNIKQINNSKLYSFRIFQTEDLDFPRRSNYTFDSSSLDAIVIIRQALETSRIFKKQQLTQYQIESYSKEIIQTCNTYKLIAKLGEGSYAITFIVQDLTTHSDQLQVLKVVSKQNYKNQNHFNSLLTEIKIMEQIRHQCVLSASKVLESDNFYYIEMQLMDIDLHQFLTTNFIERNEKMVIFIQICLALRYLHNKRIVHRDIKAENILTCNQYNIPLVKVGDFGISAILQENQKCHKITGSALFMAPELFQPEGYDFKCDVWSLGVLLYIMIMNSNPIELQHNIQVKEIRQYIQYIPDQINRVADSEVRQILSHMLVLDPKQRYSIQQILELKILQPYIQITKDLYEDAQMFDIVEECDELLNRE